MCQVLYRDHVRRSAACCASRAAARPNGLQSCVVRHQPFPRCRHAGVRYGTNIVRWGMATLATYGKVALVITIIAR